jgi:mono/diheme cytochrome c family protein
MPTYQDERFPIPTPRRLVRELRLRRPPWWMVLTLAIVVIATWVPLGLIFRARGTTSAQPRVHFFLDMDKQAKFGTQAAHPWFRDGRAMRRPIEGTIARGRLQHDEHFFNGYTTDSQSGAIQFVSAQPPQLTIDEPFITRGRQRYQIYCAVCHGDSGDGNGLVNQRAMELKEAKWVPATNLMTQEIRDRADGQIFQAIRDGVRNMPSYKSQIDPRDRWAIVAYLRHLQASASVAPAANVAPPANPASSESPASSENPAPPEIDAATVGDSETPDNAR